MARRYSTTWIISCSMDGEFALLRWISSMKKLYSCCVIGRCWSKGSRDLHLTAIRNGTSSYNTVPVLQSIYAPFTHTYANTFTHISSGFLVIFRHVVYKYFIRLFFQMNHKWTSILSRVKELFGPRSTLPVLVSFTPLCAVCTVSFFHVHSCACFSVCIVYPRACHCSPLSFSFGKNVQNSIYT